MIRQIFPPIIRWQGSYLPTSYLPVLYTLPMEISILDSYEEISRKAASIITRQLEKNGGMLFCAATGNTPAGTYELLAGVYATKPELFARMRVLKLDEWGGI